LTLVTQAAQLRPATETDFSPAKDSTEGTRTGDQSAESTARFRSTAPWTLLDIDRPAPDFQV